MEEYVNKKEVLKIIKVHHMTLRNMRIRKDIESIKIGNKYVYNLNKYLKDNNIKKEINDKINIVYCRVSSNKQKEDLRRQIEYVEKLYPNHELISDIGSGLNFKRKGLQKIIDLAINGKIGEVVITYKDRLARIGYELIENIIDKYSKGKIIIINKDEEKTPTEELTKDIITIMNVYVAKINGLRKYKKKIKKVISKNK